MFPTGLIGMLYKSLKGDKKTQAVPVVPPVDAPVDPNAQSLMAQKPKKKSLMSGAAQDPLAATNLVV